MRQGLIMYHQLAGPYYADQTGLKLSGICLPLPSKCQESMHYHAQPKILFVLFCYR